MSDSISRQFEEIIVEYPEITHKEHIGKPYYSIKYIENGEDEIIGFGTYKIEILSRYIRDYFIPSMHHDMSSYSDKLWKLAYERGKAEGQPRKGKWDYTDDMYETYKCSECGFNTDDYIEYNFCPNCGCRMEEGDSDEKD